MCLIFSKIIYSSFACAQLPEVKEVKEVKEVNDNSFSFLAREFSRFKHTSFNFFNYLNFFNFPYLLKLSYLVNTLTYSISMMQGNALSSTPFIPPHEPPHARLRIT